MRKMLTAMALIALFTPVLMDEANAATVTNKTLATINRIEATNHNTLNVGAVEVIDANQLGGESLLANLVATKLGNTIPIQKGKNAVLISHGWNNKTRAMKGSLPSLSVGYERNNRPLPATRGKPVDIMRSGSLLAGGTGGLRGSGGIVWRGGGNLLGPTQP